LRERPAMVTTATVFRGVAAGAVPRVSVRAAALPGLDARLWCRCEVGDAAGRWDPMPMAAAPEPVYRAAALRRQQRLNRFRTAGQLAFRPDARERPWPRSPVLPAPAPRQAAALRSFRILPPPWPVRCLPAGRCFLRGRVCAPAPRRAHQSNWSASSFR